MLPIALTAAILILVLAPAAGLAWLVRRRRVALPSPAPVTPPVEPRRQRAAVLTEAIPAPATISGDVEPPRAPPMVMVARPPVSASSDALDTLDALLAELESATGRIDGADTFDEGSVAELEGLAARLEAAAESIAAR